MPATASPDIRAMPERVVASGAARPSAARVDYVDALRVALILLVVAHHSVEAYVARHVPEIVMPDPPIPGAWAFLAVNAAFFMGLFFFLAGYYTPGAFDRKGAGRFVGDRFRRIGIPFLLGVILVVPLAEWMRITLSPGMSHYGYWDYVVRGFLGIGGKPGDWPAGEHWPQVNFGPMWFLEHLLVYALLYAAWRAVAPARRTEARPMGRPTSLTIFLYAAALAAATFVAHIWYPQDRWIAFLGFIQMEPAHLPQYASLFVIGILAGRGRWIETMPRGRGLAWLAVGIALALLVYAKGLHEGLGQTGGGAPRAPSSLPEWQPCVWEAFLCTSLCVGLPVAFRELAWGVGRLWKLLSRNLFAIYVFHFPFVMLVQWALLNTDLPKWSRLLLTWPLAVTLTVAFSNFVVLRLPGLRRVF